MKGSEVAIFESDILVAENVSAGFRLRRHRRHRRRRFRPRCGKTKRKRVLKITWIALMSLYECFYESLFIIIRSTTATWSYITCLLVQFIVPLYLAFPNFSPKKSRILNQLALGGPS